MMVVILTPVDGIIRWLPRGFSCSPFSTICCVPDIPSDGVTNDITLETLMTGPCSSRVVRTAGTGNRPDEGPANAQRRQLVLKMLAEI